MNKRAKALGRWLFYPYKCRVCKHKMNINDGLTVDPSDDTRIIHKGCKRETNRNHSQSIRKIEGSF